MITAQEVFRGIYAAWRLFLRDRSALALFDNSIEGYWKSFICAVVILPGFFLLVYIADAELSANIHPLRIVVVEGIGYVIGWVAWPLATAYILPLVGCGKNYIRYIVAYNWSSGTQIAALLLLQAFQSGRVLSDGVFAGVGLVALLILLFYHGFIIRITLDVAVKLVVALVIGEFFLGQMIRTVVNALLV